MTSRSVVQILAADDWFALFRFGQYLVTEPVDQQGRLIAEKLNPVIRLGAAGRKAGGMTTGIGQDEVGKLEQHFGGVRRLARVLDCEFPPGRDDSARCF